MASKPATIPRFLLPQLSWKSHSLVKPPAPWIKPFHRSISSQARAWKGHGRTSLLLLPRRQPHSFPNFSISFKSYTRSFSNCQHFNRDHHFDTLKFVQRLNDEGFSEEQSKAMMLILSDVIEESIQNLTRTMVLKEGGWPYNFPTVSFTNLPGSQMPTGAPTRRKSISPNFAPSFLPSILAIRL